MSDKKTVFSIKGTTQTDYPDSTSTVEEETIGKSTASEEHYARTGASMGATIPTGNYANVKVSVWVEIKCEREELDEANEVCLDWCDEKLSNAATKIKEAFGVE